MNKINASFRDPSGFVFRENDLPRKAGKIRRQINLIYKENYDLLISSGLYKKLVKKKFLIPHKEIKKTSNNLIAYKVIEPVQIPFISYPYEWCYGELKDAALLTLKIQKIALEYGMILKDASAFNIQFLDGSPILIDTLSFEKYIEGKPWTPYRQFCEHFLAPLLVAKFKDPNLIKLLLTDVKGIPIQLAAKLLSISTWFKPMVFIHIILQSKFKASKNKDRHRKMSKKNITQLIESLYSIIKDLEIGSYKTKWRDYYTDYSLTNYGDKNLSKKKTLVKNYLNKLKPKSVWDIGANTGVFSLIASEMGAKVVAIDNDLLTVETCYKNIKKNKQKNILPLWIDITNPTPGIGWQNKERESLLDRPHPDTILALAVIHHLAISNNLPLEDLAYFFWKICKSLIIEFIPKKDFQVQTLLNNREDIFKDYNERSFEKEFGKFFNIKESLVVSKSGRKIYLMTCKK